MRRISEIAAEIERDWKKVSPYAQPYLDAMRTLDSIDDHYFYDTAKSCVLYFLGNAQSWRGDVARRVKKELHEMAGV